MRLLDEAAVERLLPAPLAAVELARRTLVSLAGGGVELPPKVAIHPRPETFVNAMPAHLAEADLSGLKLVSVYRTNPARGLPAVQAIVVLLDPETGALRALVAGIALTAARTAATSGACLARLAPAAPGHLALTGAGVEARSHLRVAAALGVREARVYDHRPANVERLRAWAAAEGLPLAVEPASSGAAAADGAAVVVTGVPIGVAGAGLPAAAVRADALVLPLDYSTSVGAELASGADLLLSDDPPQLASYRRAGHFAGWREPDGAAGRWLADDAPARPPGRVVVASLGVGATDVAFADAVLRAAEARGEGMVVPADGLSAR
jgi:ornithine cyclodeaminase/alanine dehydrogenase-like protein (mu-crystallin family)